MSKTLHRNLQAKIAELKGPEWDSSDDEKEKVAETKITKAKQSKAERKRSKMQSSKGKKEKSDAEVDASNDGEEPTVVYIGHLPNEFEEKDLQAFLRQFGDVLNSRISRSVKTGGSRGYAFVRFADPEVAKIVADTLQGYFLGKRRLVCHLVDSPKRGMFFDTGKVINLRKTQRAVEKKKRQENLASASKMKEITSRLVQREKKKRKKLEALGIDYQFPGYQASAIVSEEEDTELVSKKKRKESIDSVGSSSSRKRKDSVGSEGSATKKRKDSIGSVGSDASSKKSKRESSTRAKEEEKKDKPKVPQSESKKKKKSQKKGDKRRLSAP